MDFKYEILWNMKVFFFLVAIVFTCINIKDRFFSERVISFSFKSVTVYFIQTTVTHFSRKLSEIDFPMFLTFFARPGYNISLLSHCGFKSEFDLFRGKHIVNNDTVQIYWGNASNTIQGERER